MKTYRPKLLAFFAGLIAVTILAGLACANDPAAAAAVVGAMIGLALPANIINIALGVTILVTKS